MILHYLFAQLDDLCHYYFYISKCNNWNPQFLVMLNVHCTSQNHITWRYLGNQDWYHWYPLVSNRPEKISSTKSKKIPKPYKCLNSQIPKSRRLEVGAQRYGNRYHMISHDNRQVALGGHCLCLAASQQRINMTI